MTKSPTTENSLTKGKELHESIIKDNHDCRLATETNAAFLEHDEQRMEDQRMEEQRMEMVKMLDPEEQHIILVAISKSLIHNGIKETVNERWDEEMEIVACDNENVYKIIYKYYYNDEISREGINILTDWIEHKTEEVINPDRLRLWQRDYCVSRAI